MSRAGFTRTGMPLFNGVFITRQWFKENFLPEEDDTSVNQFLWLWGYNYSGVLGNNHAGSKSSPIQTINGGNNWDVIATSYYHSMAIKTDGTLWVWGNNSNGQLGDNTLISKSYPIQTFTQGNNWSKIAAGSYHSMAIKTTGTLWLWGTNNKGQLGDNSIVDKLIAVQTAGSGNNWTEIAAGNNHSAAIKTNGTLWLWGHNYNGQLGDNTTIDRSSPVQTISGGNNWSKIAAGNNHSIAIKTDGTLWGFGGNFNGQLGDNSIIHRSSPVQTISGGNNWSEIAGGYINSAAIKTDGVLWLWGSNSRGQLGDNTIINKSSPVQTISGGNNWSKVTIGGFHSTAIKTDSSLWGWGYNWYGQLGDNTTIDRSSPVQTISGGNNWSKIAAGYEHSMALRV